MRNSILLIGFILLITIISCDDKFKPASADIDSKETPSHESWNSSVIFTDSSVTKAVLYAGHISVFTEGAYTTIDSGAKVDFYKDGKIVSTLTGKRGKINDRSKDIEIFDSVKVVSSDSVRLSTSRLNWNNTTRKVSSEEFVRIKTPSEEIEGYGFESDQSLSNYRIFRVSGTFSK
jgi:LPS export ABC transporter protein LptC